MYLLIKHFRKPAYDTAKKVPSVQSVEYVYANKDILCATIFSDGSGEIINATLDCMGHICTMHGQHSCHILARGIAHIPPRRM